MLLKLIKFFHALNILKQNSQLLCVRSFKTKKSAMSELKTAYFHQCNGSDKFKVFLHYVNESVGVNRQFNFERNVTETVKSFLTRVTSNIEKIAEKKINRKRKKTESENEAKVDPVNISVELVTNECSPIAEDVTCKDVFFSNKYPSESLKLRIVGLDYIVSINSPWIDKLTLPLSMMAGFPVYPNCFETRFTDKHLSTFIWMKSSREYNESSLAGDTRKETEEKWVLAGEGFIYIPVNLDIGCKLKVTSTPKNFTSSGPPVQCESKSFVEAGPGPCPFEFRHQFTQNKVARNRFRVVSYNILADVYSSTDTAQNELFNYCPAYALSIDYRKQLFLKELLGYNADLVCLQEVDTKVFEVDLVPVLGEQGLVGVHAKKSTIREGVSCFYSSSKFKLLEVQEVVLSQELVNKSYCSHILSCVDNNTQLKERITGLGTTAQAVLLESLENPNELLVVANTHLYFHPDADHIRLLQGGIVMAFLTDVVNSVKQKNPTKGVSLICCGDFNSVPECGIYKLMTTKTVPADFVDWKSKPEEAVKDLSLSQPFSMDSACGTPEYTNYTVSFAACLDYIFYQTDKLYVDLVVPLPTANELREHRAIPSVVFPSDHVALVADLGWCT